LWVREKNGGLSYVSSCPLEALGTFVQEPAWPTGGAYRNGYKKTGQRVCQGKKPGENYSVEASRPWIFGVTPVCIEFVREL
jgi:hypothetical protein